MNQENPMCKPRIAKVTVNIGVGEAGERLKKAETVLENLTGHKPVETISKTTNKEWGIRKGMPIGCKVTLRGKDAEDFLIRAFKIRKNRIPEYSFDDGGNVSFGIPDHTLFEDQKYDPEIGIFGMDVCVTMVKAGYRVKERKKARAKIGANHRVTVKEAVCFLKDMYGVDVVER